MALIKCPECGNQVSDKAATCPHCGVAIAGQTPVLRRRNSRNVLIVAFVVSLVIVGVVAYFYTNAQEHNELDAWENAMRSSDEAVLQNYLDMYADAPQAHRDSIMSHLALLNKVDSEWQDALVNNSRMAFLAYLRKYPESIHKTEALLKLDSIDWADAVRADNMESYKKYISLHADGQYIDEAQMKLETLEKNDVTPADKQLVADVLTSFFDALGSRDEDALTMNIAVSMNSFLHKENATKLDVLKYMHRLYEPADINNIQFRTNNDWLIEKTLQSDNSYIMSVEFSVDEKIDRNDTDKETFVSYKVKVRLTSEGKIKEMNMKRSVVE